MRGFGATAATALAGLLLASVPAVAQDRAARPTTGKLGAVYGVGVGEAPPWTWDREERGELRIPRSATRPLGAARPQEAPPPSGGLSALRVGKWLSLGVSAGSAAYGFHVNGDADRAFRELEGVCESDPERCAPRNPDGSFADDELERRYRDVVEMDDRARAALVVGQLGIVLTAVLFILDLGDDRPDDIPYVPPPAVSVRPGGLAISATLPVGALRRRGPSPAAAPDQPAAQPTANSLSRSP